jgi:hypothetical protein
VSAQMHAALHAGDIDRRVVSGDEVELGPVPEPLRLLQQRYLVRRRHYGLK